MKSSNLLLEKLKDFEGLRLEAYLDAAGVPTIGYGHTGRDVKQRGLERRRQWEADRFFSNDGYSY